MTNISKALLDGTFNPDYFRWCFHHGKSGQQKVAEGQTTTDLTQSNADTGAAQGTFSQFEGPVQNSPFYKALLTSGIENTSRAYDTARSNMRSRANQAGFGYNQPVAQGADDQVSAQEASALADVPNKAMVEAAPLSMKAGEDSAQLGENLGEQAGQWNTSAWNMNKKRAGLWDQLFQSGQNGAQGAGQAAMLAAMA